jgi:hypothetical protein
MPSVIALVAAQQALAPDAATRPEIVGILQSRSVTTRILIYTAARVKRRTLDAGLSMLFQSIICEQGQYLAHGTYMRLNPTFKLATDHTMLRQSVSAPSQPTTTRRWMTIGALLVFLPIVMCTCFYGFMLIPDEIHATTTLPGYQITVSQRNEDWGAYYVTYLNILRDDGWQYSSMIDSTTPRHGECTELTTYRISSMIYFRCDNEPISASTPYVDIERRVIYLGRNWRDDGEKPLVDIAFHPPK